MKNIYAVILILFSIVGLMQFSNNVRTVQALGLFACGAVFGTALAALITAFKARMKRG